MGMYFVETAVVDAVQWLGLKEGPHDLGVSEAKRGASYGWVDLPGGGRPVYPGDWLVLGDKDERYPIHPGVFEGWAKPLADGAVVDGQNDEGENDACRSE